jgi:hypothetical protein
MSRSASSQAYSISRVEVEVEAGERPGEVGAAAADAGVQGVRVCHRLLDEPVVELARGDVEPGRGDDPPSIDGVLAVRLERDELVIMLEVGERQRPRPAHGLERRLARALEQLRGWRELGPGGGAVEAADAHVDGMDLPSPDHRHQHVAGLLHQQPALDDLAMVGGHREPALVAEEVGRVQEVHVQRVTLEPLAAVEQPPEVADRALVDGDPAGVLHCAHRAGLVGDGTDPAYSGGDVGRLGERAAAQEGLEEARRLVDPQLHVGDLIAVDAHVHGPLALHPGQHVDGQGAPIRAHGPRSRRGTARRPR